MGLNYIISTSDFFKNEIPPIILGAFYSRYKFINDYKYIITVANYKPSAKIPISVDEFENDVNIYKDKLNKFSKNYNNWCTKKELDSKLNLPKGRIYYVLENDLNLTEESFFNKLYAKVVNCDWIFENGLSESKKDFIRGFMELRGSVDTTRKLIAQDYFYNSHFEIKKARLMVDYLDLPTNEVNINFRELQNQFVSGENKRNTQFRVKLFWYLENIGLINDYKTKIVSKCYNLDKPILKDGITYFNCNPTKKNQSSSLFDERLNYYSINIFNKKLSTDEIEELRKGLGFDSNENEYPLRNQAIVELVRLNTEDKCACCKNKYSIKDRSFISKRTNRYYFEIHHMISLGQNKELDDIDNLVKLCPVCHAALKRGLSQEDYQKSLINEIYKNSPNVQDFATHYFNSKNISEIVDLTYQNLK